MKNSEFRKIVNGIRARDLDAAKELHKIGPKNFVQMCTSFNISIGLGQALVQQANTLLREAEDASATEE